jgi:hypothetical protein
MDTSYGDARHSEIQHLIPLPSHNMLPNVPQLLNTYRFYQEINSSMRYAAQNDISLAI